MSREDKEALTRGLLDHDFPEVYLDEWTQFVSKPKEERKANFGLTAMLIFRLGLEWFALPIKDVAAVVENSRTHVVPAMPQEWLIGLVNIRGKLQLCFSLKKLFGLKSLAKKEAEEQERIYSRMLVIERDEKQWVFPADEIFGVHFVDEEELEESPASIQKHAEAFTKGLFTWKKSKVATIDIELLLYYLEKSFSEG